jgi:hypothetical protein
MAYFSYIKFVKLVMSKEQKESILLLMQPRTDAFIKNKFDKQFV